MLNDYLMKSPSPGDYTHCCATQSWPMAQNSSVVSLISVELSN